MQKTTCSTDECEKKTYAFGICQMHYRRHKRAGTTTPNAAPEERFWSKVDKSGGCWIWQGTISNKGYGRYVSNGKHWYAHRLAYSIHFGEVDPSLDVDHKCRNRSCVNPSHLQAVSHKENLENQDGPHRGSASGIRGVSWRTRNSKWVAQVAHNGKTHYLGMFSDKHEAGRVAEKYRLEVFTNNLLDRTKV